MLRLAGSAFIVLAAEPSFVLIDTAVVGHLGPLPLGALGIGGTLLSLVAMAGPFLDYGTTGRAARWYGAGSATGRSRKGPPRRCSPWCWACPVSCSWAVLRGQLAVGRELMLREAGFQPAFLTAAAVAARMGTAQVAAHQIGLELWEFTALLLDSFAIAAQSLVGAALRGGAGRWLVMRSSWQL